MLPIFTTPTKAIELEAAMVDRFRDPSVKYDLQFWTTTQSLIVPASIKRQTHFDKACDVMNSRGWPLAIRKTGGGATPQGPGILNVALAYTPEMSENPTIHGVYDMFCTPLTKCLESLGLNAYTASIPKSFCDGEYNIVVNGQKVMGTAQRWTRVRAAESRQVVFAHALILLDADLEGCIEAVNHLHQTLELVPRVEVDAHANLLQLVAANGQEVEQQQVTKILSDLFLKELVVLTT